MAGLRVRIVTPAVACVALASCLLINVGAALGAQGNGVDGHDGLPQSEAAATAQQVFTTAGDDVQAAAWAYACVTCHGAERSASEGIPTLAGMPAEEIVKAMLAYAASERQGLLKQQIARGYDEAVLRRIGTWYETLRAGEGGQP